MKVAIIERGRMGGTCLNRGCIPSKLLMHSAEYEVLNGADSIISKSKDITLMVEVHGSEMFGPVTEFLDAHSCRIVFEKKNEKRDLGAHNSKEILR